MVIATGGSGLSLNARNTYAHEFGHLINAKTSTGDVHLPGTHTEGLMRPGQVARGRYLASADFDMMLARPVSKHVTGTGGPFAAGSGGPRLAIQANLFNSTTH